jgi:hypothetical protein
VKQSFVIDKFVKNLLTKEMSFGNLSKGLCRQNTFLFLGGLFYEKDHRFDVLCHHHVRGARVGCRFPYRTGSDRGV